MRNDMSSVCWTLTATCLDCTCVVDWGSSPHRGSTFWTHLRFCCISPDSVFCNIVSFSCCLHFPSQNTSFCLFLSLHYWKYHTGIGWFLTKALFFITLFFLSGDTSCFLPRWATLRLDTVMTFTLTQSVLYKLTVRGSLTASKSVQRVDTMGHPHRLTTRLITTHSSCPFQLSVCVRTLWLTGHACFWE